MANDWLESAAQNLQQKPTEPVGPGQDWLEQARVSLEKRREEMLRGSIRSALDAQPEAIAQARNAATVVGVAPEVAERNPDVEKYAREDAVFNALKGTDALKKAFADPQFAKLAHPEVEQLGLVERAVNALKRGTVGTGVTGEALGYYVDKAISALGEGLLPKPRDMSDAEWERTKEARSTGRAGGLQIAAGAYGAIPQDPAQVEFAKRVDQQPDTLSGISEGVGFLAANPSILAMQFLEMVPGLATAGPVSGAVASPVRQALTDRIKSEALRRYAAATVPMAAIQFGTNYQLTLGGEIAEGMQRGMTPDEALARAQTKALTEGGVNAAFSFIPTPMGTTTLGRVGGVSAEALKQGVAGAAGATAAAAAVGEEITLSEQILEFAGEFTTAPVDIAVAALSDPQAANLLRDSAAAQRAQQTAQAITDLGEKAAAVKMASHSPAEFQKFVESMGDQDLYVDAREFAKHFWSQGQDPKQVLNQMAPELVAQYEQALQTSGDIRMPVAAYTAKIAPTEHNAVLSQHVKLDPDDMTPAQAAQWEQNYSQQLKAQADRVAAEATDRQVLDESADKVRDYVAQQIVATGRFDEKAAKQKAELHRAFSIVMGKELGVTPEEVYQRFGLQVQATMPGVRPQVLAAEQAAIAPEPDIATAVSPTEAAQQRFAVRAEEAQLTEEQKAALAPQAEQDVLVPEVFDANELVPALERAAKSGEAYTYVESDLFGLGRLNAALGSNTKADALIREVGKVYAAAFPGEATFRRGGAKFAAIVPASTDIEAAKAKLGQEVARIAQEFGVSEVPAPRIPGYAGTELTTVSTPILQNGDIEAMLDKTKADIASTQPQEAPGVDRSKISEAWLAETSGQPGRVATRVAEESRRGGQEARGVAEADRREAQRALDRAEVLPTERPRTTLQPDLSRQAQFDALADTLNLTPEQRKAFAPKTRRDDLTGWFTNRDRRATLEHIQKRVREEGVSASYGVGDVSNLGGMTNTLGREIADIIFRNIAEIVHENLRGLEDVEVVPFRHGGDEISFAILGRNRDEIKPALVKATQDVRRYVAALGLQDLPHAKYLETPEKFGTGVYLGAEDIYDEGDINQIFDDADVQIELAKKAPREKAAIEPMKLATPGQQFAQKEADVKDLIVQHNLTAENLLHAVKMGGIPVPSLAVTRKETPLTGFGEITLLGSRELIDPKGYAATKVFGADIYSPRYPSVSYQFTPAMRERLDAKYKAGADATARGLDWEEIGDKGPEELSRSGAFMWQFLKDNGVDPEVVRKQPEEIPESLKPFAKEGVDYFDLTDDTTFVDAVYSYWEALLTEADSKAAAEEDVAKLKARAEERGIDYFVRDWARKVAQYQRDTREAGKVDNNATRYALEKQIREAGLQDDALAAAKEVFDEIGPNERIFQGFTPSGTRRYIPHTLDNVVKILKKELRGGEGFNYGVGSLRAKFTPQFKSVEQIRKAKDRLVSPEDFKRIKDEIDDAFWEAARAIHSDLSGQTAVGIMEDAAKMGVVRAAKDYGFEVSDTDAVKVAEFLTRLRELPTEYFEAKILREVDLAEFSAAVVPEGVNPKVIKALESRGVKDIRYYKKGDDASRTEAIGQFENLFFQQQRGAIAMGEDITQAPSVVALLENADLSTFLHETGHFFFEVYRSVAGQPDAPAKVRTDMEAMVKFAGVDSLEAWNALTPEQRRAGHEKVAEAFEVYLFEGKAPSEELKSVFRTFRTWLTQVYRGLKSYLSPDKITPEVRGVFDRMLATEDQIAATSQQRAFMPLFTTAEESGMSDEEWVRYQELVAAQNADAIDTLERRSLRDMKWLANAKSRELKRLQAEAKEIRKAIREEVATQVYADDVHLARYFLTRGKMPPTHPFEMPHDMRPVKLSAPAIREMYGEAPRRKSDPKVVDPTIDSITVAIAKLGGLDTTEAAQQGVDPATWGRAGAAQNMPVFGKRVFRPGGLSFDGMAELLSEEGYFRGDYSANELLDKVLAELGGDTQYSTYIDPEVLRSEPTAPDAPDWRSLRTGRYGAMAEEGAHPDEVATWFGYDSGDALIRALVDAPKTEELIDDLTDQRMLEEHADLSDAKAIEQAANEALHNEAHRRMVATELKRLTVGTGSPSILNKAARDYAIQQIAATRVAQLRPRPYLTSESRAGRTAMEAMRKGDRTGAAQAKRDQILAGHLFRVASDESTFVDKALDYFKKFDKDDYLKRIDPEEQAAIAQLLGRYDLRKGTPLKEIRMAEHVRQLAEDGELTEFTDIPAYLLNDMDRRSYKELTLDELHGLYDTVKSLAAVGRNKKELIAGAERVNFEAAKAELMDIADRAIPTGTANPIDRNTLDMMERLGDTVRGLNMPLVKVEQLAQFLDGNVANGPWARYLFNPIAQAENDRNNVDAQALYAVVQQLEGLNKKRLLQRVHIPSIGQSLTVEGVMTVALNMGNDSNYRKLKEGWGWDDLQVQDIVRHLTRSEWETVQGIWDAIGELWPTIVEVEKSVTGIAPKPVEPRTVPLPAHVGGGDLKGGYFPVVYDPNFAVSQRLGAAQAGRLEGQTGSFNPKVSNGFTKGRVAGAAGRIQLSNGLSIIPQHLAEVSHLVTHKKALRDVWKILRDPEVSGVIKDKLGLPAYQQFTSWAHAVANGRAVTDDTGAKTWAAWMGKLRRNVSLVAMGFKYSTFMAQFAGFGASMEAFRQRDIDGHVMGLKYLGKAVGDFGRHPVATYRFVTAKSEAMKNRVASFDRDVRENFERITGKSGHLDYIRVLAMKGTGYADMAVALPSWMGAYRWAQDQGLSEAEAVAHADKIVRTAQGSGGVKDLNAAQRAASLQFLTLFYSYFAAYHGRLTSIVMDAKSENDVLRAHRKTDAALRTFLLVTFSATLGEILAGRLPKCEEDDPACVAGWAAGKSFAYLFAGIPIARDIASSVETGYSYDGTALTSVGEEAFRLTQQTKKVIEGEGDAGKFAKHAMSLAGYAAGIPGIAQLNITAGFAWDLYTGEDDLEGPADLRFFLMRKPKE